MIIEVAYALADKQTLLSLEVEEGITLGEAIETSGILASYPQIELSKDKVGVFGKLAKLDTVLRDKDGKPAIRDIVQFVKYADFKELGMRELALEVLGEVPD